MIFFQSSMSAKRKERRKKSTKAGLIKVEGGLAILPASGSVVPFRSSRDAIYCDSRPAHPIELSLIWRARRKKTYG